MILDYIIGFFIIFVCFFSLFFISKINKKPEDFFYVKIIEYLFKKIK